MSEKKPQNTKAEPMTYEVLQMPNLRAAARRAAAAGEPAVKVPDAEVQTTEINPKKGGK